MVSCANVYTSTLLVLYDFQLPATELSSIYKLLENAWVHITLSTLLTSSSVSGAATVFDRISSGDLRTKHPQGCLHVL